MIMITISSPLLSSKHQDQCQLRERTNVEGTSFNASNEYHTIPYHNPQAAFKLSSPQALGASKTLKIRRQMKMKEKESIDS